jgi:hypothetical protein
MGKYFRIVKGAFDPNLIAKYGEVFRDFFARNEQLSGLQSGIPIYNFPDTAAFREQVAGLRIFSSPLYWLADFCSIRRQRPDEAARALPWHQDSAVVLGRTFGWIRGFVVWLPFTPIDSQTPGLEVIDTRWPLMHFGNKKTGYLEAQRQPSGLPVAIDNMALGDALVFDINCPHRTRVVEGMTKTRFSVDLRFTKRIPPAYRGEVVRV